jgi:hypothetical protein
MAVSSSGLNQLFPGNRSFCSCGLRTAMANTQSPTAGSLNVSLQETSLSLVHFKARYACCPTTPSYSSKANVRSSLLEAIASSAVLSVGVTIAVKFRGWKHNLAPVSALLVASRAKQRRSGCASVYGAYYLHRDAADHL